MKINKTTEYSLFQPLDGNRAINELHLRRIINSMKETPLVSPITVNENFEIIDGQHRFEASRHLGIPVYYFVVQGYSLPEVQTLNLNSKNWTTEDYLDSYINLGYDEYIRFRDFYESFDFKLKSSLSLANDLQDNGKLWLDFKHGNFVFDNEERAYQNAEKITILRQYFDRYNDTTFVQALIKLMKNEDFSFSKFVSKVAMQPTSLVPCRSVSAYLALIEDIYNYKSREKVLLRY